MKILKKETKEVEVATVQDIVCNLCGRSCMKQLSKHPDFYGVSVKYLGGYLSTNLKDYTSYEFDFCEECIADLMLQFKVPATIENDLDI